MFWEMFFFGGVCSGEERGLVVVYGRVLRGFVNVVWEGEFGKIFWRR